MKSLTVILALFVCGCTTARNKVGGAVSRTGRTSGQIGTGILITSGIHILTLPLMFTAVPFYIVAFPAYYCGCALSDEECESDPFVL